MKSQLHNIDKNSLIDLDNTSFHSSLFRSLYFFCFDSPYNNAVGAVAEAKEVLAPLPNSTSAPTQTKIKKIIQENQDIGKLSNLVPPLVEQSLEFFLIDLLKKCEDLAKDYNVSKLTPPMLKKALLELDNYEFLKDALDDVEDLPAPKLSASKARAAHSSKRGRPEP